MPSLWLLGRTIAQTIAFGFYVFYAAMPALRTLSLKLSAIDGPTDRYMISLLRTAEALGHLEQFPDALASCREVSEYSEE